MLSPLFKAAMGAMGAATVAVMVGRALVATTLTGTALGGAYLALEELDSHASRSFIQDPRIPSMDEMKEVVKEVLPRL